jgi:hypothetical protein
MVRQTTTLPPYLPSCLVPENRKSGSHTIPHLLEIPTCLIFESARPHHHARMSLG